MRTPEKRLSDAIDIVAGGRDPDARRALVADLPHAPQLAEVVAALEQALGPMAAQGGDVPPPDGLFARIEAVLDAEATIERYATNLRLDAADWVEIAPGVLKRKLWDDHTFLARLEPGRAFPPHDHPWTEHCIVISGDMVVDGVTFGPGDYHAPHKGSRHGDLRTENGMLLLVRRAD
jgi:anti-sigma factor ChrR (cupin superfamily)